ncbi:CDKN2AIP N-terminal-like protein isoform X2 [Python bivittatus]|uniref:CDKN2AIP N-terminal-like protein isoform X2 n=1 Tax=Python bivittatus TaxID=176946 RepID=A0A9F5N448_PYTBI|nr:CDKN2AIP N-terminal-like protein isoform X2 [Python bivittatus]
MVRGDNVVGTEPEFPEQFRSYSENEKHWQARRAFILRNTPLGGGEALPPLCLDQLLSLSMVWANHLFLGCRSVCSEELEAAIAKIYWRR